MDDEKQNINPTILNPSDLPSRLQTASDKPRPDGGTGLFDALLPSRLAADPFAAYASSAASSASDDDDDADDLADEPIDAQEVYDLIATISDPEHPLSLGSLAVVNLGDIFIHPPPSPRSQVSTVEVLVTPTITHCSLATVIGLGVRVRLEQALPPRFRVDVKIKEGTHSTGDAVTKQLGDKERVAAALENGTLMNVLKKMLSTCK